MIFFTSFYKKNKNKYSDKNYTFRLVKDCISMSKEKKKTQTYFNLQKMAFEHNDKMSEYKSIQD